MLKRSKNIPSSLFTDLIYKCAVFWTEALECAVHTVLCQYQPPVSKQKTVQSKRFPPSELCHAFGVSCDVYVHHSLQIMESTIISAVFFFFFCLLLSYSLLRQEIINLLVLSALVQKCCTCDLQMNQSIRDMFGFGVPDMICLKL